MDPSRDSVRPAASGEVSVAALCHRFGISRQTGFSLLWRHREAGCAGLQDGLRRPRDSPRRVAPEIEARLLALRTGAAAASDSRPAL